MNKIQVKEKFDCKINLDECLSTNWFAEVLTTKEKRPTEWIQEADIIIDILKVNDDDD